MGLGIKTDLYDATIWRFVGAFLVRAGRGVLWSVVERRGRSG